LQQGLGSGAALLRGHGGVALLLGF